MKRTILFVDDELINLFVLEKRFEEDYDILTAESAEDAIEKVKANKDKLDAIISDLKMPGMDGLQLIDVIKPDITNVPCFLLTGFEKNTKIDAAIKSSKVQYMFKKPFDYDEIDTVLKKEL